MLALTFTTVAISCVLAAANYAAAKWARALARRLILIASTCPQLIFLLFCAFELGLGIYTNDKRYIGADMVFGIALIVAVISIPVRMLGARWGKSAARS